MVVWPGRPAREVGYRTGVQALTALFDIKPLDWGPGLAPPYGRIRIAVAGACYGGMSHGLLPPYTKRCVDDRAWPSTTSCLRATWLVIIGRPSSMAS